MAKDKSSDVIEMKIIKGILDETYPVHSVLKPERELAKDFQVGRPTVREALQRLEKGGWIQSKKGQPSQIMDYLKKGNLSTIVSIMRYAEEIPNEMIQHFLDWRISFSPVYVKDAVQHQQVKVISLLASLESIEDNEKVFSKFDWNLQKQLANLSPNPLYLLTLNSFDDVYEEIAQNYFLHKSFREASLHYYQELLQAALEGDSEKAEIIVRNEMKNSFIRWGKLILNQVKEDE
ncbi:GntR family transcriptional regulator [Rossellomorea aquimaris]|uniref:GntR family transcriptional regulator n=1 Tax=Rossellomorea aquimaris TaxID=189382 RepID=UPI0007D098BB|nr:GntR family transcriptional regulator [Rossellomorea aquimaris]